MWFSKKSEAEKKVYAEKIEAMKNSIIKFKEKLTEGFIMGLIKENPISVEFEREFKQQIEKEESSATKRWCQDVAKKLKRLDDNNKKRVTEVAFAGGDPERFEKAKEDSIKEFAKIFHINAIDLKSKFFTKAAVNEIGVKKSLEEIGNETSLKKLIEKNSKN